MIKRIIVIVLLMSFFFTFISTLSSSAKENPKIKWTYTLDDPKAQETKIITIIYE